MYTKNRETTKEHKRINNDKKEVLEVTLMREHKTTQLNFHFNHRQIDMHNISRNGIIALTINNNIDHTLCII